MRRLLIRPGAIGDVILSLPALEAACLDDTEVWAPRVTLPLIRFTPNKRAIADTGLDLVGVVDNLRTRAVLAELAEFDSIYSWYGTNRPEFRDAVGHLPVEFFPALPPLPEGIPSIDVPRPAYGDLPPLAVIHPFASAAAKRWPLELFQAVATRLESDLQFGVNWCAPPLSEFERETLPPELEALSVRHEDLYELATWLAQARLYIGNDSGIAHLAAAVGVPVVAIFLSSDPSVWMPRGDRVRTLVRPDVDDVVQAARSLLL